MSEKPYDGKIEEFRPDGKWLGSIDFLGRGEREYTIKQVYSFKDETMSHGEKKSGLSLEFEELPGKRMILNNGHKELLVKSFKCPVEETTGKKITLHVKSVKNPKGSGTVLGIGIKTQPFRRIVEPFIWNYLVENDMESKDSIGDPENNEEDKDTIGILAGPQLTPPGATPVISPMNKKSKIEQSNEHRQCIEQNIEHRQCAIK